MGPACPLAGDAAPLQKATVKAPGSATRTFQETISVALVASLCLGGFPLVTIAVRSIGRGDRQ